VYSREPAPNPKADLLASIGAHYCSAEDTPLDRLPDRIGNIDLVYEATGASSLAFQAMKVLGTNGIFVFTGVRHPVEAHGDLLVGPAQGIKNVLTFA
jgi:threonine dehydrogenase-like Zn-dependent dehydrogenase